MKGIYLLLTTFSILAVVNGDHWSAWSDWSKCSRTCDGGASYQLRKCLKSYIFRTDCHGDRIRYQTCNNDPCSASIGEFRAQQCSVYDETPFRGELHRWVPHPDPIDPCALKCQTKDKSITTTFAPKVLDGTRCTDHSLNMCINGKCWVVGCDHVLGSRKRLDSCGVCGGDNSCRTVTGNGRFVWKEGAYLGCTATCGVGTTKTVGVCWDRILRKPAKSTKFCDEKSRPPAKRHTCFVQPCPAEWRVSLWQPCTQSCGGGMSFRKVGCAQELEDRSLNWLNDTECKGIKPVEEKECNSHICPKWYAGKWSPCSVSCDSGMQQRAVICRHVGDEYCDLSIRPETKRECNTEIPCYDKKEEVIRHLPERKQVQESSLAQNKDSKRPETNPGEVDRLVTPNQEVSTEPRFIASEWGPCSKTCGEGVRQRYVRCKVYLRFLETITDLSDSECTGQKPRESEPCQGTGCIYVWRIAGHSTCSHSCLGGVQETLIECVQNGTRVNSSLCDSKNRPPSERRLCNDIPCPPRWRTGIFGNCSVTCGGGVMSRTVACIQEVTLRSNETLPLPDVMCGLPAPPRNRSCNTNTCATFWWTGEWSQCSSTCGKGEQYRLVKCMKMLPVGTYTDTKSQNCNYGERPQAIQSCQAVPCPKKIRIKEDKSKLFQLNPVRKVVLSVGGEASVLLGTRVTVRCKTTGGKRPSLVWLRNGMSIGHGKHVRELKSGKVRIRRTHAMDNNTVFTCVVGTVVASLYLRVHTPAEAEVQRNRLQVYLQNRMKNFTTKKHIKNYSSGAVLLYMHGPWSDCPALCGASGIQRREITCELYERDIIREYPLKHCRRQGLQRPSRKRTCIGDWKCDVNITRTKCCVWDGTQNTNAICENEGRDQEPCVDTCDKNTCLPVWKASSWGECTPECGQARYKARSIVCIWRGKWYASESEILFGQSQTANDEEMSGSPMYFRMSG
ncbi:ADAMTS-like protein 1 isoform X2 [Liolophura sinensis]|uniref:ADAMTS-like protein 1 isoform X2 n=1 Tax=Liolophura sinensis TaxID=3198878 RepID=UPI00315939A0